MKSYHNLTQTGKLRRISRLAEFSIRGAYDLNVDDIRLYAFATNPLYLVRTSGGDRFILRMGYPGWRTLEDLRSEAMWLEALHRDTDIGAPEPLRTKSGDLVLEATGQGVPYTWNATLFTWLEGRLLEHYLTPSNLEKFGRLFALLHVHGSEWEPPPGFTMRRFDSYLSRGEPELLFSDDVMATLGRSERCVLADTRKLVQHHYAELDDSDLRVIHCDLWHENVKLHRGRLLPFDFEDTVWGYRLHDIAMGMLDLQETVGDERYRTLLDHFRNGYCSILQWPEGNMEVLQMGRMLWLANWYARFNPAALKSRIENYVRIFNNCAKSGILNLDGD